MWELQRIQLFFRFLEREYYQKCNWACLSLSPDLLLYSRTQLLWYLKLRKRRNVTYVCILLYYYFFIMLHLLVVGVILGICYRTRNSLVSRYQKVYYLSENMFAYLCFTLNQQSTVRRVNCACPILRTVSIY